MLGRSGPPPLEFPRIRSHPLRGGRPLTLQKLLDGRTDDLGLLGESLMGRALQNHQASIGQ
jgi:hypothetical protein